MGQYGRPSQPADYSMRFTTGATVDDVVKLRWHEAGHVSWRLVSLSYPLANNILADQVRRLLLDLCASFPQLLAKPLLPTQLLAHPDGDTLVEFQVNGGQALLLRTTLSTGEEEVAVIQHTAQVAITAKRWFDDPNSICLHPRAASTLHLYSGHPPPHVTSKRAKRTCLPAHTPLVSRPTDAPQIRGALTRLSWRKLHSLRDTSASEVQTWHRLKAECWPTYSNHTKSTSCDCSTTLADPLHQVWLCPKAKAVWKPLLDTWSVVLDTLPTDTCHEAIFSLCLSLPPTGALLPPTQCADLVRSIPEDAVSICRAYTQQLWTTNVLTTVTHLWRHHWGSDEQRQASELATQASLRERRNPLFLSHQHQRLLAALTRALEPQLRRPTRPAATPPMLTPPAQSPVEAERPLPRPRTRKRPAHPAPAAQQPTQQRRRLRRHPDRTKLPPDIRNFFNPI